VNHQFNSALSIEGGLLYDHYFGAKHQTINAWEDSVIRSNIKDFGSTGQYSVFGQFQADLSRWDLIAGLRYTSNSQHNDNSSARITAIYKLDDQNSFKFIFGQSFRTPTLLELYFDHPTVIGNINLKPETANSLEFAYVLGKRYFFMQLLTYYHRLENLIQRVTPVSGPPSVYQNVAGFDGGGIEFESKYSNPKIVDLFFNYTFMEGFGNNSKENYNLIPKHTFKLGINKSWDQFFVSSNNYFVSSVNGNPKLNIQIPGQFLTDLNLGYSHVLSAKKIWLKHTFSAKNLTNSEMLIPEYIRQTDNINSQATTAYGRRFIYILNILF